MTTLVPTSEEDPIESIVRFTSELAWKDAGPEVAEPHVSGELYEAHQHMLNSKWPELASLMVTSADLVISRVSDKDVECIFTVICSLVTRATDSEEALKMAELISAKLVQQPSDRPALRLKILFNLYNLLEDPYSKFLVYMKALSLAEKGKVTESVIPSFKKIESLLQEWNIGNEDKRELFLTISNILKESKSTAKDSFIFLTKYLATFSDGTDESYTTPEAKELAVRAIIEFVKSPDMFQSDLLDMPVVGQLEKDEKYGLFYQLLKIFLTQKLDAYIEFYDANSATLKTHGLVHEDCIAKMRLMSLIELSSRGSSEIPYSLIKEVLAITEDEVEYWIVKAITSKVIDCKMDQMNRIVIVSRHTERVFGQSQWQALHSKLAIWKANVANAICTIQASKPDEGAQAQGMTMR